MTLNELNDYIQARFKYHAQKSVINYIYPDNNYMRTTLPKYLLDEIEAWSATETQNIMNLIRSLK